MSTIFDSITKYAVAGHATDNAYNDLRDVAAEVHSEYGDIDNRCGAFEERCRIGENDFMDANYHGVEEARHKTGKRKGEYKFRTYLPRSYCTAKSAINKAMGAGIDPAGVGKSALEKATKAVSASVKSQQQLVREAWVTFTKRLEKLELSEAIPFVITARADLDKY